MDGLARLRALTSDSDFCLQVRHLVCVMASSRGGSSVSMEMFRHSRSLLHFRGEVNPFLALANLTYPASGTGSDALGRDHATERARRVIGGAMGRDAGQPATWPQQPEGIEAMSRDVHWRLTAQWPDVDLKLADVAAALEAALSSIDRSARPSPASIQSLQLALCERLPPINPWYYDVDPAAIAASTASRTPPTGAPGLSIIEEPPFVLHQPWRAAQLAELNALPLMMKTPSNAYRLPFLRALFPNARIQVLHLTRNPAAAINGLVDGWRFRGFHAHRLSTPHAIEGAIDHDWWKYDLPPGWEDWTSRSVVEVAGFQWRSAHTHILEARGTDVLQVRFEDLLGPARLQTFEQIFEWMGAPLDAPMREIIAAGVPPVMATERPRQRRWFERADLLEPVVAHPETMEIAHALGYGDRTLWT